MAPGARLELSGANINQSFHQHVTGDHENQRIVADSLQYRRRGNRE
jgi:hypothetical protein